MPRHFVHNKNISPPMFENKFFDYFSRVHFSIVLIVYVPVVCWFLYQSVYNYNLAFTIIITLLLFGLFCWSIMEYTLHRFVFHYHPVSKAGKRIHFILHGVHHDFPSDSRRLVMPPGASIPLAVVIWYACYAIFGSVYAAPFFSGFVIGYIVYDMSHYAVHHLNYKNKLFQTIKKHHMLHHYKDPNAGFGFTSKIWDQAFGTDFKKDGNKVI